VLLSSTGPTRNGLRFSSLLSKGKVVELLLQRGVNFQEKTSNYLTPLFIAAQQGHFEIVTRLLVEGVDFRLTDTFHCNVELAASLSE
jgi:hypothetical protein